MDSSKPLKTINYLSHGKHETGGYRHEFFLFQLLISCFEKTHSVISELHRKKKLFENLFSYFRLLFWAYKKSGADINIVSARLAIPALLRNKFSNNEVWIVIHNFDEKDNKSFYLKHYYSLLFYLLRKSRSERIKFIAVSQYWREYFINTQKINSVSLFHNYFDVKFYGKFQNTEKRKMVHLGQLSSKNDPEIFELADKLHLHGYETYFSTLSKDLASEKNTNYKIIYFDDFDSYLELMSTCLYTLALTIINEGWNRVAHESLLVGTAVIGYDKAGLGDLLKESNSLIVNNIQEALNVILEGRIHPLNDTFISKYDIHNAEKEISLLWRN